MSVAETSTATNSTISAAYTPNLDVTCTTSTAVIFSIPELVIFTTTGYTTPATSRPTSPLMTPGLSLFDELVIDGLLDMQPESYEPQPLAVTPNTISQPPLHVYMPTPPQILQLQEMSQRQMQRLVLNVGGTRFEISAPTLQSQPDSVLPIVSKESPMKPYKVNNVYTYFWTVYVILALF